MPAAVALAIQGIMALVAAMPQIEAVAQEAKKFFAGLFKAGLITADVQNALNNHVDSIQALWKAGVPAEFQVQPDPVTLVAKT